MRKIALCLSSVLLGTAAIGQHHPAPRKHAVAKPKPSPSEVLAATTTRAQVLARMSDAYQACKLADSAGLLWSLKSFFGETGLTKGEFETSAAFAERVAKVDDILNGHGGIVACVRPDEAYFTLTYNADAGSFHGEFNPDLVVGTTSKDLGTYRSETAMGAKATVDSELVVNYKLDMSPWLPEDKVPCLHPGLIQTTFDAPVSAAEAPLVKRDGYLVIYGWIRSPFVSYEERPGEPTLDYPIDTYRVSLSAPLQPTRLALVAPDGATVWQCTLVGHDPSGGNSSGQKSVSASDRSAS